MPRFPLFDIETYNPKEKPPLPTDVKIGEVLNVMATRWGHLQIPYDAKNKAALENAIDEVVKKLRQGWILYVWKINDGESEEDAKKRPATTYHRDNLDVKRDDIKKVLIENDMLLLTDANSKKMLTPVLTSG